MRLKAAERRNQYNAARCVGGLGPGRRQATQEFRGLDPIQVAATGKKKHITGL